MKEIEYCLVDSNGEILGVDFFPDNTKVPEGYVKIWEGILQNPVWSHAKKQWVEVPVPADEALKRGREDKIFLLKEECQKAILGRFKAKIRNKNYTFSYDTEAQQNLAERWQLFQNNMVESLMLTARDAKTDETIRLKVNKAEFTLIYLSSVKHKEDNISRLHDLLVPLVKNSVSLKQIADIHWTNEMIYPNEPSIIVKDDATLDKNINKVEMKADMATQANQLASMAMMEIANFVFANGASAK